MSKVKKILGFILESNKLIKEEDLNTNISDLFSIATEEEKHWLKFDLVGIEQTTTLRECIITVSSEYSGLESDLLIFIPPRYKNLWVRKDHIIDFLEETITDNMTTKIKYLTEAILPYTENFIVASSLSELSTEEAADARFLASSTLTDNKIPNSLTDKGIDFSRSINDQIYMQAPIILKLMARKLEINKEKELRPAIVTYWS